MKASAQFIGNIIEVEEAEDDADEPRDKILPEYVCKVDTKEAKGEFKCFAAQVLIFGLQSKTLVRRQII